MKNILVTLFILGFYFQGIAQIRISETEGEIHPRALLEIDSNKGVILPLAENFTQFPNYNENELDLFSDDPSLEGMLLYNKEEKKLFIYDGESWIPSNAKSHRAENKITLLRSTAADITKVNILNISTRDAIPFNLYQVINDKNVNNANIIPLDLEGNDGYADTFQISESGWYKINPSIMIKSGGGLTVGNIDAIAVLNASFVNDPDNSSSPYSKWWAIMQHDFSLEGLLISVGGGNKAMNFEYVRHFDAGDRIRFEIGIRNPDGLSVGSGITYMCSNSNSFLYIEKLD
jgi:hypothetical protein